MKASLHENAIAFQQANKIKAREKTISQKSDRSLKEAVEVIIRADSDEIENLPRRERIEAKKIRGMIE